MNSRVLFTGCLGLMSLGLSGCGVRNVASPAAIKAGTTALGAITGKVHGGQQPVSGAHVYVFAVGTGGYGTASASLLTPGVATAADGSGNYYVTTDGSGQFSVTGDYVCTPGTQVYLLASGGNPGSGSQPAIGLMAGLGQCPATGTLALQVPQVVINEVSTVALAWAMAGFATDATHIAGSNTTQGQQAAAVAMANVGQLISIPSGQALATTPNGAGQPSQALINTIGNILASCVNGGYDPSNPQAPCTLLFGYALSAGTTGSQPTNTAGAAINLAHYASNNAGALFLLQTAAAPFQPELAAAPQSYNVYIDFNNLSMSSGAAGFVTNPFGLAVDGSGNVYVQGQQGYGDGEETVNTAVFKYTPTMDPLWNSGLLPTVGGNLIAVDASGNAWLAGSPFNLVDGTLSYVGGGAFVFSSSGTMLSPANGYGCFEDSAAYEGGYTGVAFDASGNAYLPYFDNTNLFGTGIFRTTGCTGTFNGFGAGYNGALLTDSQNDLIANFGSQLESYSFSTQKLTKNMNATISVAAVQSSGDIVGLDANTPQLDRFNDKLVSLGTVTTGELGTLSDLNNASLAEDGSNATWLSGVGTPKSPANAQEYGFVTGYDVNGDALTTVVIPTLVYQGQEYLDFPEDIVPDLAGSLWVSTFQGLLYQYIGMSAPTAEPQVPGNYGVRP